MHTNFKTTIEDNPIELLKMIKKNALNYQEYKYLLTIITDLIKNLFNTCQHKGESLQDYLWRFKTAEEIM